jgi:hypothetical protein
MSDYRTNHEHEPATEALTSVRSVRGSTFMARRDHAL